ncbi:MAG: GNAT family N-acetyltransferase [Frankiaceae bacterium]|nr:GNAT family N-acetyltransferase [Frankiaceae bacterium]MBV9872398.1 GNAT family N-acetyltransferase [Frankiaceae bacterium]
MNLIPLTDPVERDALLAGDTGDRQAAPGWPHADTPAGFSFLDHGGRAFLVIDDEGRIAGECGTKSPPTAAGVVEIGYGLAAGSRGKRLGSAAVAQLVALLSDLPDVRIIEAEVHESNPASWRILLALGFAEYGGLDPKGFQRYRKSV